MEKRYQVFVCSTFADLREERQEVVQALLELDCIPTGMERIPAADEDRWSLIRRVIDDCDYFIVIIAGTHGSIDPGVLRSAEMEFRYAVNSGKPIMGFVRSDPGPLPAPAFETTDDEETGFVAFRELVRQQASTSWNSPSELGSQVSRGLLKLIRNHPAVGWIRGDIVPGKNATEELSALHRRIDGLEGALGTVREARSPGAGELAHGADHFRMNFSFEAVSKYVKNMRASHHSSIDISWDEIFFSVLPLMIDEARERTILDALNRFIESLASDMLLASGEFEGMDLNDFMIDADDFVTVKIQMRALGLIREGVKLAKSERESPAWGLTPYGDEVVTRLRTVRRSQAAVDSRFSDSRSSGR